MKTMRRRGSTPSWGAGLGLLGLLICVAIGMWMYAQMGEVALQGSKSDKETGQSALERAKELTRQVDQRNVEVNKNIGEVDQIKRQLEKQILDQNKQIGAGSPAPTPPTTQPAGTATTTPAAKPPAGTPATTTPPATTAPPATQPVTATPPVETPAVRTRPKNLVGGLQKQIDERNKELEQ